jgi:membrane associated rhomboid family serine protease
MLWLLPMEDETHVPRTPWCTWALVALNVLLFVPMLGLVDTHGLDSADPKWYQFIASDFMHGSVLHLAGNLYFLWLFGDDVEDAFGRVPFLALYFLGGLAGDLLFVHANDLPNLPTFGASGCIAALAGAYAVLYCDRNLKLKVMLFVFPVWTVAINAVTLALLWFGADVALTAISQGKLPDHPGVNYVAHGVGVSFGVAVAVLARSVGLMDRFARAHGSDWWGYWRDFGRDEARRARGKHFSALTRLGRPNAWGEKGGRK